MVTFLPKQLGRFNKKIKITLNDGIKTIYLHCVGTCSAYDNDNNENNNNEKNNTISSLLNITQKTNNKTQQLKLGNNLIGGIDKLPVDFRGQLKLVTLNNDGNLEINVQSYGQSSDEFATKLPPTKKKITWNKSTCTVGLLGSSYSHIDSNKSQKTQESPNLAYTFGPEETQIRTRNKIRANQFVEQSRKFRQQLQHTAQLKKNQMIRL